MKKFPHFRVRDPLVTSAPRGKGRRYAYRNGKLVEIDRNGHEPGSIPAMVKELLK